MTVNLNVNHYIWFSFVHIRDIRGQGLWFKWFSQQKAGQSLYPRMNTNFKTERALIGFQSSLFFDGNRDGLTQGMAIGFVVAIGELQGQRVFSWP